MPPFDFRLEHTVLKREARELAWNSRFLREGHAFGPCVINGHMKGAQWSQWAAARWASAARLRQASLRLGRARVERSAQRILKARYAVSTSGISPRAKRLRNEAGE